jgi:hypothetical protein
MWIQYWAIPVPFLAAGLAWPLSRIGESFEHRRSWMIGGCVGISLLMAVSTPVPLLRLVQLTSPGSWPPVDLHRTARVLVQDVPAKGRILTLTPLWALEGGGTIYRELAAGSIAYRVADQLTPEKRALTRTVGPESLEPLTRSKPPQAILIDAEDSHFRFLEAPLADLAGPSWIRKTEPQGPTLLLAP